MNNDFKNDYQGYRDYLMHGISGRFHKKYVSDSSKKGPSDRKKFIQTLVAQLQRKFNVRSDGMTMDTNRPRASADEIRNYMTQLVNNGTITQEERELIDNDLRLSAFNKLISRPPHPITGESLVTQVNYTSPDDVLDAQDQNFANVSVNGRRRRRRR